MAQTNPDIVWAGTGEAWAVRDMDMMGDGIYKSTDAGETWTNMGLVDTGRIGTIVIHPANPDIVLVCALGRATGPQRERGVYRTENGGKTWQQVLFVNENTGCSGLQISQQNPNIVLAGTWEIELQTHVLQSGGMGSGIYLSKDGGRTFAKITHPGLPRSPYGKTDVAIAPSDGKRMYALIQTGSDGVKGLKSEAQGSLWRSDDGGADMELGELGSAAHRPRRLLHPHSCIARRSESPARGQQHAVAIARRREDLGHRRRRLRRLP